MRGPVERIVELEGIPLAQSAHLLVFEGGDIASLIFYWPLGHDPFDPDTEHPEFDSRLDEALRGLGLRVITYLGGEPIQTTPVAVREELFLRVESTS